MRTLMRLVVATFFLSGMAGSCLTAYVVGYSQGMSVNSRTPQRLTNLQANAEPVLGMQATELQTDLVE